MRRSFGIGATLQTTNQQLADPPSVARHPAPVNPTLSRGGCAGYRTGRHDQPDPRRYPRRSGSASDGSRRPPAWSCLLGSNHIFSLRGRKGNLTRPDGFAILIDCARTADTQAATVLGAGQTQQIGVSLSQGGSQTYFAMWKFYCWGDGTSETASDNTAWSAVFGNGQDVTFPAGESTYNTYLITDSVQNVAARMDDLLKMGVK